MKPQLQIQWESRWREFITALPFVVRRSPPELAGELGTCGLGRKGSASSLLVHGIAILLVFSNFRTNNVTVATVDQQISEHAIQYIPSDSLPKLQDAAGDLQGKTGKRGGRTLSRGPQPIRVRSESERPDLTAEYPKWMKSKTKTALNTLLSIPPAAVRLAPTPTVPTKSAPLTSMERPIVMPVSTKISGKVLKATIAEIVVPPTPTVERPKVMAIATGAVKSLQQAEAIPPSVRVPTVKGPKLPEFTPGDVAPSSPDLNDLRPTETKAGALDLLRPQVIVIAAENRGGIGVPPPKKASISTGSDSALAGMGRRGIGTGTDSGAGNASSTEGIGRGTGKAGARMGASTHKGLVGGSGPGGVGNSDVPGGGVAVDDGVVNLGAFTEAPRATTPRVLGPRSVPAITIVASPSSGSALNQYGTLNSDRVYTIYLPAAFGVVIMEYGRRASATASSFEDELTAPEPLQMELPAELRKQRAIISCVVTRDGTLRDVHLLEKVVESVREDLLQALATWRFRPALRGDEPIEVDALLGFHVDTR
ncbi:MAG TPA: hypothetical protein VM009_07890 [Terriglobales bacterium]|nr:hypothetical protein [Terriglobales bacterium]